MFYMSQGLNFDSRMYSYIEIKNVILYVYFSTMKFVKDFISIPIDMEPTTCSHLGA